MLGGIIVLLVVWSPMMFHAGCALVEVGSGVYRTIAQSMAGRRSVLDSSALAIDTPRHCVEAG